MPGYDEQFFAEIDGGARSSAAAIVPIIMDALNPSSVVDVGCGTGTWLATFRAAGVKDVLGIDGDYVPRSSLNIPVECFEPADLNRPVRIERSFDLALSLEVAEHLVPNRAESLVADLVRLAPVVCFSAAIPLQGGVDHLNERWQDEWAATFKSHGYRAVDVIRAKVWDNPEVRPWYAQNMLIYAGPGIQLEGDPLPMRLVHPARYEFRLSAALDQLEHPVPLWARRFVRETGRTVKALVTRLRRSRPSRPLR
jgi:SAM-dependent methyltransferase